MYPHRARISTGFLLVLIAIFVTACGGGGGGTPPPVVTNNAEWLVPIGDVFDGGPGKDGIPALKALIFSPRQRY
ncbi:MAG: hypothetical protein IID58_02325 [Proteobacteria bacterium]|nr:hypothetical protein [Pseudomonadota bacterium]